MRKPFTLTLAALACAVSLFTLAKAQESDPTAASSVSNAKQIALATLMYCQDYDEMFPAGKTIAEVKPKILPYIKVKETFIDPISGKDFMYNAALNKLPQKSIKEPAKSVMFYSPTAHTDGMYTIAFTDGHVKREGKMPSLTIDKAPQKAKKIPNKPLKRKR